MPTVFDAALARRDVSEIRDRLQAVLEDAGVSMAVVLRAMLVVEELVTNAFDHGSASMVSLAVSLSPDGLSVEACDDGIAFDPTTTSEPDTSLALSERTVGGLGLHIVRRMARDLAYRREAGANVVSVALSLEPLDKPKDISGAHPHED